MQIQGQDRGVEVEEKAKIDQEAAQVAAQVVAQ